MSINAMNVVWLYYPEGGPMLVLALALADEADDYGASISASVPDLAKKTRQTERAVQSQIKRFLSSALLQRIKEGLGRGQKSEYRLNLSMLVEGQKKVNAVQGIADEKGERRSGGPEREKVNAVQGFEAHHTKVLKEERPMSSDDVAAFTLSGTGAIDDDDRLARWIFEQLRRINPKHREPQWSTWCRDIRRMRERDKRTRREIAMLFAWANSDPFWQANVLCPATLRRQWERLEMQRRRNGGPRSVGPEFDSRCTWERGGVRCQADGVFGHPGGHRYCREHEEENERDRR